MITSLAIRQEMRRAFAATARTAVASSIGGPAVQRLTAADVQLNRSERILHEFHGAAMRQQLREVLH